MKQTKSTSVNGASPEQPIVTDVDGTPVHVYGATGEQLKKVNLKDIISQIFR
jgi:hypothetical protein